MIDILSDRTFRNMWLAQVAALFGTGLATVALALLAYDLAGGQASLVLGTVFTIKMVAYVCIAPVASALAERLPRRRVLVGLDIVRCAVALLLPFVTQTWQVFVLIAALQVAAAGFTPIYQATIPDILPEEDRYTKALSLSRLAYDLEAMISPALAAVLLSVVSASALFGGTALGFAASAVLIFSVALPHPAQGERRGIFERTTRGTKIYLATPRLRGLLAFNVAIAMAGAMVLVNTVLIVQGTLGLQEGAVAVVMAAFGAGSMGAALALPRVLERLGDRPVMSFGAFLMGASLLALALHVSQLGWGQWALMLAWFGVGVGFSTVLTPSGRLLRRSAQEADRPAIFAAQFALSHACWLFGYPLAGWLATAFSPLVSLVLLGVLCLAALGAARWLWPADDPAEIAHSHPDLPPDHPHLRDHHAAHSHTFRIDDLHPQWPRPG